MVVKLRPSDGTVVDSFSTGAAPQGIAFVGKKLWVTNGFDDDISVLAASDGTLFRDIAVKRYPAGILFDGMSVWTCCLESDVLIKTSISR